MRAWNTGHFLTKKNGTIRYTIWNTPTPNIIFKAVRRLKVRKSNNHESEST